MRLEIYRNAINEPSEIRISRWIMDNVHKYVEAMPIEEKLRDDSFECIMHITKEGLLHIVSRINIYVQINVHEMSYLLS